MAQRHLVFVGVPHPVVRCVFAVLERVLAAEDVSCGLVTEEADGGGVGNDRIYLRADASDAAALVAVGDMAGARRNACRLIARLDDVWRHLPTISIDAMLNEPMGATTLLSARCAISFAPATIAVLRAQEASMREAAMLCRHPVDYVDRVEPSAFGEEGNEENSSSETLRTALLENGFVWAGMSVREAAAPLHVEDQLGRHVRAMLVLAPDVTAALSGSHVPGGCVVAGISVGPGPLSSSERGDGTAHRVLHRAAAESESWPTITARFDRIEIHDLARLDAAVPLWRWATSLLAPGGIVAGREASADVVPQMLARLMRENNELSWTFIIEEERWTAIPAASWKS